MIRIFLCGPPLQGHAVPAQLCAALVPGARDPPVPRRPALREHAGEPEEQLGGLVEDPLQGVSVSLDVDQKVEEVNVVLST